MAVREPTTILAATQLGGDSDEIQIAHSTQIPTGISAYGLAGAEEVTVKRYTPAGWITAAQKLTASDPTTEIVGFGRWKLTAPVTASDLTLFKHEGIGVR